MNVPLFERISSRRCRQHWLCALLTGCLLGCAACHTTPEATKTEKATTAASRKKADKLVSAARNDDVNFQAFVNRLRQAVQAHDANAVASMMTTNFGYRLDPPAEGDGVFAYWDQNNVWPELELVLREPFVVNNVGPGNEYMVAPAEFVTNPDSYTGYRAGIVLANGTWKFAYFVSGRSSE